MVDLAFTDEQEQLRRAVRDLVRDRSSEDEVRQLMATVDGFDPATWAAISDMGLVGLAVPEALGGAGGTTVDVGVVLEELGRALACTPYFSTAVLAVNALLLSDDPTAQAAYLPQLASGALRGTLATLETGGAWESPADATTARRDGDSYRVTGHKTHVLDGHTADLILVAARLDGAVTLLAVTGDGEGVTRRALTTMDETRKLAVVELDDAPAVLVGRPGDGGRVVARTLELAAVGLAAEQVGGAQQVLDMAVEYAKTRVQFGRPIGSFQAIKHKCADMLVEVESARSAAYYAQAAAAAGETELPMLASVAKAYCSDAYVHVAAENIQIHGGIGFTWEHPAHLYLKRAKSSQLMFGDPAHHRARVAELIGAATVRPA